MAPTQSRPLTNRWRIVVVFASVAVALLGAGAIFSASQGEPSDRSSVADRVRAIEQTRLQALVDSDTATARSLIASDFQLISPQGSALSREDYLDAVDAGAIDYRVFEPSSPIAVKLSGDSAALRYQADFDLVVGGDTHLTHQGWVTDLYELRHGHWQVVWEQATAIPNNVDLFVESIKPVH